MARRCQISGKQTGSGNTVSHSNRKTKRKFKVNLITKKIFVADENRHVRIRMSARMLKTLNNKGVKTLMKKYGQDLTALREKKA
jgi:large subunit ribosomal protein L28